MALTEEMAGWLVKHTGFETATQRARKALSKQMEAFWRRLGKVRAALAEMPADSPLKQILERRLAKAVEPIEGRTDARASDLRATYEALNAIKADARQAAEATRRGICAADIERGLARARDKLDVLLMQRAGIDDRLRKATDKIAERLGKMRTVAEQADSMDAAIEAHRNTTAALAFERNELVTLDEEIELRLKYWLACCEADPDVELAMDIALHKLEILRRQNPEETADGVHATLATMHEAMRRAGLDAPSTFVEATRQELRARRLDIERRMRELTDLSGFDTMKRLYTDNEGNPLGAEETEKKKNEMEEVFKDVEARQRELFRTAAEAYRRAVERDREKLSPALAGSREGDQPVAAIEPLQSFDAAAFFDDMPEPEADDIPEQQREQLVEKACEKMRGRLDTLIKTAPRGDELFDIAVRTRAEWREDIIRGLGFEGGYRDLSDGRKKLVRDMAKELWKLATASYPNQTSKDYSEITLDGKTFAKVREIGKGGFGAVNLYEDAETGEQIVLKTSVSKKVESRHLANMAKEARNHHRAMGGSEGQGHPNLVDMKGMVMGPNGEALVAMELAPGGDARRLEDAMALAAKSGLIEESARQAIIKQSVREIALGLKHMHDRGVTHFDVKTMNVFVGQDGEMKIGDLGLGEIAESKHETVKSPKETTPSVHPTELQTGEAMSDRSDAFMLGAMLDLWADPHRRRGEPRSEFRWLVPGRQQTTPDPTGAGSAVTATALDRLRNALLEPDPEKRPAMEAVLESAFLVDGLGGDYVAEDLDELRKAQLEYASTVGKELKGLNARLDLLDAEIARLEKSKTGRGTEALVAMRRAQVDMLERRQAHFLSERDSHGEDTAEWKAAEKEVQEARREAEPLKKELLAALAELGKMPTEAEIADLDRRILELRSDRERIMREIKAVHADEKHRDVVERLRKANAPFRN